MTMTWQDVQRMNNIAFLQSQIACAQIELAAMNIENEIRLQRGETPAYAEAALMDVINKYGIGHNAALTTLQNNL